jgi:hypothetical protein
VAAIDADGGHLAPDCTTRWRVRRTDGHTWKT